jgi:hypothetical protein
MLQLTTVVPSWYQFHRMGRLLLWVSSLLAQQLHDAKLETAAVPSQIQTITFSIFFQREPDYLRGFKQTQFKFLALFLPSER